jgi:transcriptional regulator with XRE-family HTH domain
MVAVPTASSMSDLGDFIRMQRQLSHMTLRQLAELSDVSNAYLSQLERGLYQPSAQVLKSLAGALELSAEELYRRAGLLDGDSDPSAPPSVEEAIRLDDALTPEQKEALIGVYRGLSSS